MYFSQQPKVFHQLSAASAQSVCFVAVELENSLAAVTIIDLLYNIFDHRFINLKVRFNLDGNIQPVAVSLALPFRSLPFASLPPVTFFHPDFTVHQILTAAGSETTVQILWLKVIFLKFATAQSPNRIFCSGQNCSGPSWSQYFNFVCYFNLISIFV